jgi:hypothetical protein
MSLGNQAEHWRLRATEAHVSAENMEDAESKLSMLNIAREFERLAERAEKLSKMESEARSKLDRESSSAVSSTNLATK